MKKIFIILLTLLTPIIAFGDLLPEPDILDIDDVSITDSIEQENSENTLNNSDDAPNILDIKNNNAEVNIPGQDDDNVINGDSNIYENEEVEDEDDDFDPLAWLYFGFCNQGLDDTTRSYNGAGVQGEPFKICAMIYNSSNRDITVQMDLTDAIVDENDGTNSCTLDYSFGEFLTSGTLGKFVVPAENYVIKEFEITFPLGFDGVQKGCLSYHAIYDDEDEEGIVITIRKGYYMDFFVGSVDIKNEITTSELATNLDDNGDLILSFWVNNIGNMENTFDIQGAVKGLFGYNKKFEATDGQLAPGKSQFVEINLGSLPSYGGKFDIDFTINGTPYFSYDISNANVDPARLEPKSWTFGTTYFKMPWLILAVVVIFILLLIVLFKKPKQKVIYVQQAQQPQQPLQPVQQPQQNTQQYTQPVQPNQPIQQPTQPEQQPTQPVQQPQQSRNPNYPQN